MSPDSAAEHRFALKAGRLAAGIDAILAKVDISLKEIRTILSPINRY